MARNPSPAKTHRAKDYCTIEQAEWIAQRVAATVVRQHHAAQRERRWYRRLWRFLTTARKD